jgi:hypothetical protein
MINGFIQFFGTLDQILIRPYYARNKFKYFHAKFLVCT